MMLYTLKFRTPKGSYNHNKYRDDEGKFNDAVSLYILMFERSGITNVMSIS